MKTKMVAALLLAILLLVVVSPIGVSVGVVDFDGLYPRTLAQDTQSQAISVGPGVETFWSSLPKETVSSPQSEVIPPMGYEIGEATLQELKNKPFRPSDNPPAIEEDSAVHASEQQPQSSLLSDFEGLDNLDQPDGYLHRPPDPHIAAGINHIGVMVNSEFTFYTKGGTIVMETSFQSWWSNVYDGPSLPFDPRIAYDHHEGRWLMVCLVKESAVSYYLLSVSQSSDPTGGWWNWRLNGTLNYGGEDTWADYPDLGFDGITDGAIYITSNQFTFTTPYTFKTSMLNILPKSALYNGVEFSYWKAWDKTNEDGSQAFTLRTAWTHGNPGGEYLINSKSEGWNKITLWRVNPTFPPTPVDWVKQASIPIGVYSPPPNAKQLGSTAELDTIDNRIYNCMYRNGHLYAAFTEANNWGSGTVAAIRYLKIDTSSNSADLNVRYGSDGKYYWVPAIYSDMSDNILIVFARSSSTEYAGIRYTGRGTGATQPSALLKAGTTYIAGYRWGDYFGIATDPVDESKVWIYGEWAKDCPGLSSFWDWGTWIGEVEYTYDVTIKAYCYNCWSYLSISVDMDGSPTGRTTPYTFRGLTGTHTFTVQIPGGHIFLQWRTGETSTTISVSSGWTYTAYYAHQDSLFTIRNQEHFIMETIYDPESVDPAWAYDIGSRALIFNVYDTLIFFDRESMSDFIPHLATEWMINQPPHPAAPPWTNNTWYFKIRTGVQWQDPVYGTLTTEDVEYSFERLIVMSRTGGPAWMINEPLFGEGWPDKSGWPEDETCPINTAVESNSTHVWFNLAIQYPMFMQILCGSWASILSKDWCSAIAGEWDGDWSNWHSHEDPANSPLDVAGDMMMGTGPYMLDHWDHGVEWSIIRFVNYWQGWPAPRCSRYLNRVTNRVVYEWSSRLIDFSNCFADDVYVPTAYVYSLIENSYPESIYPSKWFPWMTENPEQYLEFIDCMPGLPTLTIDAAMFFNFDTHLASPYVGTGSFPNGIPLDFFSDVRIRKAFAYCFDYIGFLREAYWNEAVQPTSCVKEGIPYHSFFNPFYYYDPYQAAALFQAASVDPASPAFDVWDLGFKMYITYKFGHVPGETAARMLEVSIESLFLLGPDGKPETGDEALGTVDITVVGMSGPTFEGELAGYPSFQSIMPLFITNWLNEYTDPHDDVHPFMHTYGHFSRFQSYSNVTVDALIEEGIATPDGSAREAIYNTLQLMYYQDIPSVCLAQPLKRHWQKNWVQGWYHNLLYPGQKYFYHLWKGLDGDIDGDNMVDILDLGLISGHWYPGPPIGPLGYDPIADIYPELQYNGLPKVWDGIEWVPHPSIGAVDILDAALVSKHWLEKVIEP